MDNKYAIKIMNSTWTGLVGSFFPIVSDDVINLVAHDEVNEAYPPVRVARAEQDYNGNIIENTYLKKDVAENTFFKFRDVVSNANYAVQPGIYQTNTKTEGANDYGVLFVFPSNISGGFNGNNWFFQLWLRCNGKIQIRHSINATSAGEWSSWGTISYVA